MRQKLIHIFLFCLMVIGLPGIVSYAAVQKDIIDEVYDLIHDKQYDHAIEKATTLNSENSDDIETYILLANAYFNKGMTSVVTVDTDYLESTQGKKNSYKLEDEDINKVFGTQRKYDLELIRKAVDILEKGLEVAPDRTDVYLGICYMSVNSGMHDKLIETLKKLLSKKTGDKLLETILAYAVDYFDDGDYGKAQDVYRTILEYYPDYEQALCNFGSVQVLMGEISEGIINLTRAAELDSEDDFAWSNLVMANAFIGDFQRAAQAKEKLMGVEKPNVWNYFQKAMLYINVDKEKAIYFFNEYIAFEKDNPDDARMLKAGEFMLKYLAGEDVSNADIQSVLESLYIVKEAEGALAFTFYLLNQDPDYVPALVVRSGVYDVFKQYELEAADMEKALKIFDAGPNKFPVITRDMLVLNLARAYCMQELYEKALSIAHFDDEISHAYFLGMLYEEVEDYKTAFKYFKISANNDDDPSSGDAKDILERDIYKSFREE